MKVSSVANAIALAEDLQLPHPILRVLKGEFPAVLQGEMACPARYFVQRDYGRKIPEDILPLWEVNGEYVWWREIEGTRYGTYYMRDEPDKTKVRAENYLQMVASYCMEKAEHMYEPDEICEIAKFFQFPDVPRLIAFVFPENEGVQRYDEYVRSLQAER
jgi:hypothetical protein